MGKGALQNLNLGLSRKFVYIFMMLNVLWKCLNAGIPEKRLVRHRLFYC
jgi:formate dehydrogenase maturation protein FdhE